MSERKDAEIKFRVTPTEKARWQRYAADADLGLSELIRREVNEGIRSSEAQAGLEKLFAPELPALSELGLEYATPQEGQPATRSVGTSDEVGANARADWNVKADWTFEARNG